MSRSSDFHGHNNNRQTYRLLYPCASAQGNYTINLSYRMEKIPFVPYWRRWPACWEAAWRRNTETLVKNILLLLKKRQSKTTGHIHIHNLLLYTLVTHPQIWSYYYIKPSIPYDSKISREKILMNFMAWVLPTKKWQNFGHTTPTYSLAFHKKMLTSYQFGNVFSLESFPLYSTLIRTSSNKDAKSSSICREWRIHSPAWDQKSHLPCQSETCSPGR